MSHFFLNGGCSLSTSGNPFNLHVVPIGWYLLGPHVHPRRGSIEFWLVVTIKVSQENPDSQGKRHPECQNSRAVKEPTLVLICPASRGHHDIIAWPPSQICWRYSRLCSRFYHWAVLGEECNKDADKHHQELEKHIEELTHLTQPAKEKVGKSFVVSVTLPKH